MSLKRTDHFNITSFSALVLLYCYDMTSSYDCRYVHCIHFHHSLPRIPCAPCIPLPFSTQNSMRASHYISVNAWDAIDLDFLANNFNFIKKNLFLQNTFQKMRLYASVYQTSNVRKRGISNYFLNKNIPNMSKNHFSITNSWQLNSFIRIYNVFARFLQNSVDRDVMRGAHGILGRE